MLLPHKYKFHCPVVDAVYEVMYDALLRMWPVWLKMVDGRWDADAMLARFPLKLMKWMTPFLHPFL